jgi:glc operon protein GlcG
MKCVMERSRTRSIFLSSVAVFAASLCRLGAAMARFNVRLISRHLPNEAAMIAYRITRPLVIVAIICPLAAAQEKKAPLVSRDRIEVNLAGAEKILAAARQKAAAMGLSVNIAVVDSGGHLVAFARMDGARPASGYTALTKAAAAATFRQETGPLPAKGEPDLLLSLSLQTTALAGGGKGTPLKGGVPIVIDEQVAGAVGVGGGTGEQDAEVAKAGIKALLDAIGRKE